MWSVLYTFSPVAEAPDAKTLVHRQCHHRYIWTSSQVGDYWPYYIHKLWEYLRKQEAGAEDRLKDRLTHDFGINIVSDFFAEEVSAFNVQCQHILARHYPMIGRFSFGVCMLHAGGVQLNLSQNRSIRQHHRICCGQRSKIPIVIPLKTKFEETDLSPACDMQWSVELYWKD